MSSTQTDTASAAAWAPMRMRRSFTCGAITASAALRSRLPSTCTSRRRRTVTGGSGPSSARSSWMPRSPRGGLLKRLLHQWADFRRLWRAHPFRAREATQGAQHLGDAVHRPGALHHRRVHVPPGDFLQGVRLPLQQLQVGGEVGERVGDVVGHAGGEAAEQREPLRVGTLSRGGEAVLATGRDGLRPDGRAPRTHGAGHPPGGEACRHQGQGPTKGRWAARRRPSTAGPRPGPGPAARRGPPQRARPAAGGQR